MVNKPIEVRPNCLGGESLNISSGENFDESSARLLQDVYELIDGILDIGAFEAGGLARLSDLRLDASSFPTPPTDSSLDLHKAWWFYQMDNGAPLLALDNEDYRFRHEDGSVRRIGNLHDTIRSYFDSLTTGKRWAIWS